MKFTLRDILWATVVVGLILGWWLDHRRFGLASRHLQTLIDILASHDISVQLEPEGVRAEVSGKQTYWKHYQAFGVGVWRKPDGGFQAIEKPSEMPDLLVEETHDLLP